MTEPFTMHLRGRTVASLRARSAPAVPFRQQRRRHPAFYLRTTENVLILRCWGTGRFPGWSLKAVVHPEAHGVRLEGRIRCRGEVLIIGLFSALAVVTGSVAIAGMFSGQAAAWFPLGGAVLFLALAALLIRRRRAAIGERDALAYGYLSDV